MLPNFLFIGAEKSGTTWFYKHLKRHPDICLPETKELHFFNKYDSLQSERNEEARFDRGWYESFFRLCKDEKAVGEVTPMYLCDPCAPERIHAMLPKVKLACCLRNPVDRCYSHYWMARRQGTVDRSFEEAIEANDLPFVDRGMYHEQLGAYLKLFSREQVRVLIYEEVFQEPKRHLQEMSDFLGVDPAFYGRGDDASVTEKENEAGSFHSFWLHKSFGKIAQYMRKHPLSESVLEAMRVAGVTENILALNKKPRTYPPMESATRERLRERYVPGVEKLQHLLGRSIDAWDL